MRRVRMGVPPGVAQYLTQRGNRRIQALFRFERYRTWVELTGDAQAGTLASVRAGQQCREEESAGNDGTVAGCPRGDMMGRAARREAAVDVIGFPRECMP